MILMCDICGKTYTDRETNTPELVELFSKMSLNEVVDICPECVRRESITLIPKITRVIFNDPATIVFWADGTKTVVKAHGEEFDPEKGLAMAISKKALGNGSYYPEIKKWTKEYNGESSIEKLYRDFKNSMNRISEIMTDAAEALDAVSLGGEKQ